MKLTRALFLVLVLISFQLFGCSNGNDVFTASGGGTPVEPAPQPQPIVDGFPIAGRVASPQPGFLLSSLQVLNVNRASGVSESGEFVSSDVEANGGQLMFVLDAQGNVVYLAFQKDGQEVGPRTTAQVLLYLGTAGYALPGNLQAAYREQIFNLPELDAFAAAIAAVLAQDPGSLTTSPAVQEALITAIDSMKARAAAQLPSNRLLINPSNEQSGIAPSERGADQLLLTNSYRRPAWAFVTKVATTDDQGVETPVNPPVPVIDFEVPAITGAATFASAATDAAIVVFSDYGLFGVQRSGPVAGEPVTTEPVSLPTEEGVTIKYSLEVVGPGLLSPSPTDAKQRDKLQEITLRYTAQIFLSLLSNVVLNTDAVGNKLDAGSSITDFDLIVSDFVGLMTSIVPDIATKAGDGDLQGVFDGFYSIVTSKTSEALIANFLLTRVAPALGQSFSGTEQVQFFNSLRKVFGVLNKIDLVLTSADTAFLGKHLSQSSRYVQWDIKTLAAKVKLSPLDPTLKVDDDQEFTAKVPSVALEENQFLEFHWQCTGDAGVLTSPNGSSVNDFTTAQTSGPIYSALQEGTDTITVTVTLRDAGQNLDTVLGSATTTVTVEPPSENLLVNGDFTNDTQGWDVHPGTSRGLGSYPRFYTEAAGGINGIPDLDLGKNGLFDAPFAPGGFSQTVTIPSDGNYTLTYICIGQYDPMQVVCNVFSSTRGPLATETFTPPPTIADVSVPQPWPLTGASWSARTLTFAGEAGEDVTVDLTISAQASTGNGDFAIFDNFVLKK